MSVLWHINSPVFAHGGVSVEDDTCIMTIGPYKAHFTGYQPALRASQEFCEDIPVVADAIIVLDFLNQALRDMSVDFRIIDDVNDIGVNATYDDLGTQEEINKATVFYQEAETYPRGSLDVSLSFQHDGNFIGILTAVDNAAGAEKKYISVFPFSVWVTDWWARLKWLVVVLLLGAGLFYWASVATKNKGETPND